MLENTVDGVLKLVAAETHQSKTLVKMKFNATVTFEIKFSSIHLSIAKVVFQ